ncbi:MAG: HAMP domain-containing protein [Planctomycetes bacterium]|nr:HAMP domain-containing protein [Planctomycetota bacterium]
MSSPSSLRLRLTVWLASSFGVLLVLTGSWLGSRTSSVLETSFDDSLNVLAGTVSGWTEEEDGNVELDDLAIALPEFTRESEPDYFQFFLADGTTLLRSPRLDFDLPRDIGRDGAPFDLDHDGRRLRGVRLDYRPASKRDAIEGRPDPIESASTTANASQTSAPMLTLIVARHRGALDALLARFRWVVALTVLAGLTLSTIMTSWIVTKKLRPVRDLGRAVAKLDAERLEDRIDVPGVPAEIHPLVVQFNAMLDRLEASFARERRFAANIAHELKTPICELRSLANIAMKWPDDTEAVTGFFQDVTDVSARMDRVVTDLRLVARCQAGIEPVERQRVALAAIVASACRANDRDATPRGVDLRLSYERSGHATSQRAFDVHTDAGKLELIVRNLVGNAVHHADQDSVVDVILDAHEAQTHRGVIVFEVRNRASSLDPTDVERLIEPFWRKDEARSSSTHAGLGLTLVMELVTLLGARLELHLEDGDTPTFVARLELDAAATAPESATQPRAITQPSKHGAIS